MNEDIVYGRSTGLILLSPLIAIIINNIDSWKDSRKNTTKNLYYRQISQVFFKVKQYNKNVF